MPDSVKPKVKLPQPLKNTGANAASSSKAASSATSSGVAMAATGSTASDVAMAAVEGVEIEAPQPAVGRTVPSPADVAMAATSATAVVDKSPLETWSEDTLRNELMAQYDECLARELESEERPWRRTQALKRAAASKVAAGALPVPSLESMVAAAVVDNSYAAGAVPVPAVESTASHPAQILFSQLAGEGPMEKQWTGVREDNPMPGKFGQEEAGEPGAPKTEPLAAVKEEAQEEGPHQWTEADWREDGSRPAAGGWWTTEETAADGSWTADGGWWTAEGTADDSAWDAGGASYEWWSDGWWAAEGEGAVDTAGDDGEGAVSTADAGPLPVDRDWSGAFKEGSARQAWARAHGGWRKRRGGLNVQYFSKRYYVDHGSNHSWYERHGNDRSRGW